MSVYVADERSDPAVGVDLGRLTRLARYVAADRGVPEAMELSVLCVDREAMTALNERHMGAQGPTDVLAFPIDEPGETLPGEPAVLGDVVVCPEIAGEQATERGATAQAEIDVLVVHGILHLLGHDHAEEGEREEMFGLTDRLLHTFTATEEEAAR